LFICAIKSDHFLLPEFGIDGQIPKSEKKSFPLA
jgi:hypothetical protein